MKLSHTEVKFYPEVKSQTGLSSLRASCKRALSLYKLWCNKIKTFRRAGGKDSFKVTNNTYVCEFHFNITDINVSAGRHIKTLKPNVVPSVFTFIKNKSSENQPKRRSPRKRHLNTEFVKPKQKKLTPEIIDADSPVDNNFKSNQQSSSIACENCETLSFKNMLLKEKVEVLEEEKNRLEEELNVVMFMLVV